MILESTGRKAPPASFSEAVLSGLAPDGGLYLPVALPSFTLTEIEAMRGLPFADLAAAIAIRLLGDEFRPDVIERLVHDAFSFPVPTVEIEPGCHVLELFHGPTLAFKDFGARFLARFFGHLTSERGIEVSILVATSGDTGSAVAQGFFGVPGVSVVVLYPGGKISPFQESQMATLGGNVTAVRVPGSFDDCQRLVKSAMRDESLRGVHLSSANSINIGRLLPQAFYYFAGWTAASTSSEPVVFSVPTGNVGNLTAGVIAQRMGLPVRWFVAASNVNDVVPECLRTGAYRPRVAIPTMSNAMDVGDPNNFPRLLALHGGETGEMRRNLHGVTVTEEETRATIREVYERYGVVLDPHTAVAWKAAHEDRRQAGPGGRVITLATAHPGKFGEAIGGLLGFEPPLPPGHDGWAERPVLAIDLPDVRHETFREVLLG